MEAYILLLLICFFGAVLQASVGFGFPLIAMVFLLRIFPYGIAVSLCQLVGILGVGYFAIRYFRHIRWKILLPFLVSSLSVGLVCAYYSTRIDVSFMKLYLGITLCVLSVFFLLGGNDLHVKANPVKGFVLGGISGVLNGFFAIGGPPVALYLLPSIDDKIGYIASVNAYFLLFKLAVSYQRITSLSSGQYPLLLCGMAFMALGSVAGDRIMLKIPKDWLKTIVYCFVGISGVAIAFQELVKILV